MASNTNIHSDPPKANTTFVQADPSNFRAVVQKLTGAEKLPLATQTHKPITTTKKSNFKLQELNIGVSEKAMFFSGSMSPSPEMVMASPVSPLEVLAREEEEKAIAEKGFYFHPSPQPCDPPQLLPLFPLHSPTQNQTSYS